MVSRGLVRFPHRPGEDAKQLVFCSDPSGVGTWTELPSIARHAFAALAGRLVGAWLGLLGFAGVFALFLALAPQRRWALPLLAATVGCASGIAPEAPRYGALPARSIAELHGPRAACFVDFSGIVLRGWREEAFGRRALTLRVRGSRVSLALRDRGIPSSALPRVLPGDRVTGRALLQRERSGGTRLLSYRALLRFESRASPFARVRDRVVASLRASWREGLGRDAEALVALLLLGRTENLAPELRQRHQDLGLAHLLAISGLHTVFLAGLFVRILRLVLRGRRVWPVLALLLLAYAGLTGFRPPVVRAAVASVLWLAGREEGREYGLGSALALGFWCTLVCFPGELGSISFNLSYLAVASLAVLPPLFRRWRPFGVRGQIFDTFVVSFAAQVGTATLGLHYFGIFSIWGALLTPFVAPLVFGLLLLGLLQPFAAMLVPMSADVLLPLLDANARLYLGVVAMLESLPAAPIAASSMVHADLALGLLAGGLLLSLWRRSRLLWLVACTVSMTPYFTSPPAAPARFELLAVGHGLATVAKGPFGVVLFDCGDSFGGRIAERRILAALDRIGQRHVDLLVVSHGDVDHYAALDRLLGRVPIARVVVPECPELGGLARRVRRRGVPVDLLPSGATRELLPGVRLCMPLAAGDLEGGNQAALAMELELPGGLRILVCGDQEEEAARRLAAQLAPPDVLVLPHHGELHAGLIPLLASLRPELVWASTGRGTELLRRWIAEGFGHPMPMLTSLCGDLRLLRSPDSGYQVESERSPYRLRSSPR